MNKNIKIVILILLGTLFNYAGMYLLSNAFIETCSSNVFGTLISFKNLIGIIGIAFGNYIFFMAGRLT